MHMIKRLMVNRTTRKIPCYTCLAQQTPIDPAGHQSTSLAHRYTAHRLYLIVKHQHIIIRSNHARSKQRATIRIVHQQ